MEILVIILKGVEPTSCFFFLLTTCKMKERKESILILRFLVRATGRMNLPLTELVDTAEGKRLWGED